MSFSCEAVVPVSPGEFSEQILDVERWSDFNGWGPLPGIESAMFELRTPEVVGSRIRVRNSDGSTHVEEVRVWKPDSELKLRLCEFSEPLSRVATHFDETWTLRVKGAQTHVTRSFDLYARSRLSRLPLKGIGALLKRAMAAHLKQAAAELRAKQP